MRRGFGALSLMRTKLNARSLAEAVDAAAEVRAATSTPVEVHREGRNHDQKEHDARNQGPARPVKTPLWRWRRLKWKFWRHGCSFQISRSQGWCRGTKSEPGFRVRFS